MVLFLGRFECVAWDDGVHGELGGWWHLERVLEGGDTVLQYRQVGRIARVFRHGGGGGLGPLNRPHVERAKYGFLVDFDVGGGHRLLLRFLRLWYLFKYDVRVRLRGGEEVFVRGVPGNFVGRGELVTDIEPEWMCEPGQ